MVIHVGVSVYVFASVSPLELVTKLAKIACSVSLSSFFYPISGQMAAHVPIKL